MVLHGYFLANAIRLQSLKCVVVGIVHSFMSSVHGPKRVLEIEVGGDGRWKTGALQATIEIVVQIAWNGLSLTSLARTPYDGLGNADPQQHCTPCSAHA